MHRTLVLVTAGVVLCLATLLAACGSDSASAPEVKPEEPRAEEKEPAAALGPGGSPAARGRVPAAAASRGRALGGAVDVVGLSPPLSPPVEVDAPADVAAADAATAAPPVEKAADAALNGAQVSSMVDVVVKVATGELPRDAAKAIIKRAFLVDDAGADEILGSAGAGFEPKAQPKPAPFFGGG